MYRKESFCFHVLLQRSPVASEHKSFSFREVILQKNFWWGVQRETKVWRDEVYKDNSSKKQFRTAALFLRGKARHVYAI